MSPKKNLEFAERLKRLIYGRGLNQRKLSMKIGIVPSAVSAYVHGRVPESDNLEKIAKALNTSMEYLLRGEETQEISMASEEEPIYAKDNDGGLKRPLAHQLVDVIFKSNSPNHHNTLLTVLKQLQSDLSEIELLHDVLKRK
jgi:transcriptional regulator with XRE-family HTH domain